MSVQLTIVQGSAADWPLQAQNRGGASVPTFGSSDTLTATVWIGVNQTALFQPAVSWYTANGTQTGYGQGQVLVSPTAAQSTQLEQNGTYSLEVWWTQSGTGKTACIVRATVSVLPAPGTSSEAVTTYCQLSDMLQRAPWISLVQRADTDSEGFYPQRLLARNWMDWVIINCYRGASVGLFEEHSTLAFVFGGGVGWRRSLGPSPALLTYLADNDLIVRPQIVTACAYKAIAEIARAQTGIANQWAAQAPYYDALASIELASITAEVDLNNDGIGELFINLGSVNTLMT